MNITWCLFFGGIIGSFNYTFCLNGAKNKNRDIEFSIWSIVLIMSAFFFLNPFRAHAQEDNVSRFFEAIKRRDYQSTAVLAYYVM